MIAYHNGILYSSPETVESSTQVINGVSVPPDYAGRSWNLAQMLANPTNPQPLEVFQGMNNGFDAHGWMQWNSAEGSHLIMSPNAFRATATLGTNTAVAINSFMPSGFGPYNRGNMLAPWFSNSYWVTYNPAGGLTSLRKDNVQKALWDHLGTAGLKDMPMLCGNLLIYAATGSRAGVVVYDLSLYMDSDPANDPAAPPILGAIDEGGFGGYWPELYGWGGRLFMVAGANSLRVVELTDPTAPVLAADVPNSGMSHAVYPTFQDQYAWLGGNKIDMTNYTTLLRVGGASTVHTVPNIGDGIGVEVSQYNLPIGNMVATGGLGGDQGMAIFAHQATPDTRGPEVGFHIPRAGQTSYPVGAPITLLIPETLDMQSISAGTSFIVRPVGGAAVSGRFSRTSGNAILTFFPDQPLAVNTTYEVILPAGGIKDVVGNGIASQYGFTFSTGSTVTGNLPPNISAFSASASPVDPGTPVTLTASATDSGPIEYRFDFSDGNGFTPWATANFMERSFVNAGHYIVSVQARDNQGAVSSRRLILTVMAAPTGVRPTHSRQMARDLAGKVWVVNPDNDSVARVNPVTRTREAVYPLDADAGTEDPRSIAVSADGKIWVTCFDDDAIRILHPTTGVVETTLALRYGAAPSAVCMSPTGDAAYVTLHGTGELLRYVTATPLVAPQTLYLGPTPRAIAVTGTGSRILVTRFISATNAGEVWDCGWNGTTLSKTRMIPLTIQGNTRGPADGSGAVNYLSGIAISPDGTRAYITAKKDNINGGPLFGEGDLDIDADETVRTVIRGINLTTHTEDTALRVDFDNADSASAVEPSALGDYLFVTQQGNNLVTILDTLKIPSTANLGAMVGRIGTGLAPQSLMLDTANQTLLVHNFMGRSITFLGTTPLAQNGSGNLPLVETVATIAPATEKLAADVLFGKQLFYNASARDAANGPGMSGEGYISCASCHSDGGQDGRVWDFTGRGEGLRNTTDLRGRRGMAHGNVHWSANFDETQDFVHDIVSEFGGTGFLAAGVQPNPPLGAPNAGIAADIGGLDPLDALGAYLTSLKSASLPRSIHRTTAGVKTADATTGATIFTNQGCVTCHKPANGYTDSSLGEPTLADVGTLRFTSGRRLYGLLAGIDTPTLAGVFDTAPYLHDGSARTLRDVFTAAGGEMYPVESGVRSASTSVGGYVFINNANSPMGTHVNLTANGASVTLSNVNGGSGGIGEIELRYSMGGTVTRNVSVLVNGTAYPVVLPVIPHANHWSLVRIPNVSLLEGTANTVVIRHDSSGTVSLDEMTVSRPEDIAKAQPHRRVMELIPADQDKLIAYLQQLDGSDLSDTSVPATRSGPTATPDLFNVNEATPTNLAVLANDLGTGLALTNVSDPIRGTAVIVGNVVRYTPPATLWEGTDSFQYTIRDATGRVHTGAASITIVRAFGSNPLPTQLVSNTALIGTNVAADTRARTDGLLEMNTAGGLGLDGEGPGKDELAFGSKVIAGNFRATVQVPSILGVGVGGLMLRDLSENAGARFASVGATQGTDYRVRSRTVQGAGASPDLAASIHGTQIAHALPQKWLRLDREGDVIRCFVAADGADWELVSETTFHGLGHWATLGLFTYTGSASGTADVFFAQYRIEPLAPKVPDTATGLLARWDFENTGALGTDSTGLHPGTVSGATSSTDAASGQRSLLVQGVQYIAVPHAADLDLASYTVAGWVKMTTAPTGTQVARIFNTRNGVDFTFDCRIGATSVRGNVGTGLGNWIKSPLEILPTDTGNLDTGGTLPPGEWFHVAYVIDSNTGTMSLYLNGDLKRTTIFVGTPRFSIPGGTLRLGQNDGTIQSKLDDLRIYGRALAGSDVAALAGVPMEYPKGLRREYWTGVTGTSVNSIPTAIAPSGRDVLFDGMQAVGWLGTARAGLKKDWADAYGTRLRGYLRAPATGTYTFFIASDDASELWLSNSTNPAGKTRIAWVSLYNSWNAVTDMPNWLSNGTSTGKSASITLTAGQYYFIEALHKEGTGGDHLTVGWTKPGETVGSAPTEIIPASALFADPHNGAPKITLLSPASGSATLLVGNGLALSATATDDGLPSGTLSPAWSVVDGPGVVTFGAPSAWQTTATFDSTGTYVLRLTASDGEVLTERDVLVHVVASSSVPPTGNLVLHWKLNDVSGFMAADSSVDATLNPGTLRGAPLWQGIGKVDRAIAFSTSSQYIDAPDEVNLDGTNKMTLAAWLRPDIIDGNARGILSKRYLANSADSFNLYAASGLIHARFNGANGTVSTASAVLAAGVWTHVTAVYDGTLGNAEKVKIYIDGAAVPTSGVETDATIPDNNSKLWLGTLPSYNAPSETGWLGSIDDVRIYKDKALTTTEVSALAGYAGNVAPTVTIAPLGTAITGTTIPLDGTVADDNLSGLPLTTSWSLVSGPAPVSFGNVATTDTTATFAASGSYVLQLTASDGLTAAFAQITVTVSGAISLADNLVLHWRLNDGSGLVASDGSPDATVNTGTLSNSGMWDAAGYTGSALLFDANTDYVESPSAANLGNSQKVTLAVWVRPSSTDLSSRGILTKRQSVSVGEAFTIYTSSGKVYVRFNTGNQTVTTTNAVLTVSTWTHIAAVFDGTLPNAEKVKVYINGTVVPTTGVETDTIVPATTTKLWLGTLPTNNVPSATGFLGRLDDVRIYMGRAFGSGEVGALVSAGDIYNIWAASQGLSASSALRTADPDGDTRSNLVEFYQNTNPSGADAALPMSMQRINIGLAEHLRVKFRRSKNPGESTSVIQTNTTLDPAGWVTQLGLEEIVIEEESDAHTEVVQVDIPTNGIPSLFVRLMVID